MTSRSFLQFLFLFVTVLGNTQTKIEWSEEHSLYFPNIKMEDILKIDAQKFYAVHEGANTDLQGRKNDIYFDCFQTETKKQIYSNHLKINKDKEGNKLWFPSILCVGSKIVVISLRYKKNEKKWFLCGTYVNESDGTIDDNFRDISSFDFEDDPALLLINKSKEGTLACANSLTQKETILQNKNQPLSTKFILFDENLQVISNNSFSPNISTGLMYFSNLISSNKTQFLLASFMDGISSQITKKVYKFRTDGKINVSSIDFIGKQIECSEFIFSSQGNLILSGVYNEGDNSENRGFFVCTLDTASLTIVKTSFKPMEDEFITKLYLGKDKSGKRLIPPFQNEKLNLKSDGGYFMTLEQALYSDDIVYGHLVVVGINKNGEIDWVKNIPRYQSYSPITKNTQERGIINYSLEDLISGYGTINSESGIYVIYNDLSLAADNWFNKRASKDQNSKPYIQHGNTLPCYDFIDNNGVLKHNELVLTEEQCEMTLQVNFPLIKFNGEIIFFGKFRTTSKFRIGSFKPKE